jgi:Fe-S cluster assembly ATPase SufC
MTYLKVELENGYLLMNGKRIADLNIQEKILFGAFILMKQNCGK